MCIRDSNRGFRMKKFVAVLVIICFAFVMVSCSCLLYTSDAADDLTRVDLCGRRFLKAEDGIRALVRSRGLGDVYKRQQQGVSHEKVCSGSGHYLFCFCHGFMF